MRTWFFAIGSRLTRWFLVPFGPLEVHGLEHVPPTGAFISVSNHLSNLDPLIIGSTAGHLGGRVIHFMAKDQVRHWLLIGWLASQAGVFFVRRGEGDHGAQRLALRLLAAGEPIAMFPEGTRSHDGALGAPKDGAALLALRAGVPLLPVTISGSDQLVPRGAFLPRRARIEVRIGAPFSIGSQPDGRLDRELLASGTERIMREIAALLPERRRGRWRSAESEANSPLADR